LHSQQSSSVVFPVEDGKKEKGRYKKSRKRYISPIRGEAPPWTDFHQILHIRKYAGRNHLCKCWFGKIKGFGIYGGQILGSAIEMAGHPYNSTALPRSLWKKRVKTAA